ncbi:pro-sigmaK processing inhibitor BofA family protein [Paenibacillus sp. SC116]|uniref:pro-sigmaK processing inhibitor BofA family protein n=1 Tax=Paenibacillus sp. SC116 TaxID=2968986 RepID=UPI00215B32DB|nr:pro-sigmaK processing inhibitor BofA family protein [Paenibacillus sp. SC116]MCR8846541.1 pro-sigmaK processing inhibitor BofA family protein [Paenibacillus sp. SC116]
MRLIVFVVLAVSLLLLLGLLLRNKEARKRMSWFMLHAIGAFVVLYLVNSTGLGMDVEVAVNPLTLITVGLLGVPGLLGIVFLKMAVLL